MMMTKKRTRKISNEKNWGYYAYAAQKIAISFRGLASNIFEKSACKIAGAL
jgi:hypothetical protein